MWSTLRSRPLLRLNRLLTWELGSTCRLQGFGDSLEDRKVLLNSRRISVLKVLEGLAGPPRLSFLSGSEWSASNESFAVGSKSRLGFLGQGGPGSLGSSFSGRSSVVVDRRSSRRGDLSSPALSRPNISSDASSHGWGAMVADHFASGVWLEGEASLSINHRELLAVERGLRALCTLLEGRVVAVFSDNTTAVAYLRRQGGDLVSGHERSSPACSPLDGAWQEQRGGGCPVSPQAGHRLGVDAPSGEEVFNWLCERWPVTVDLFASSLSHHCSVYFAPVSDPMAAGTDAMLQSWDSVQAYAFPPFAMINQVLAKVRVSQSLELTLSAPFWPQRLWFPELLILPPLPLPSRWDLLRQPHVRRFHQNLSMLRLPAWRLSGDS